jgi:hypothetical protein
LSNASAWRADDGCFNSVTFYNNIVDYFEVDIGTKTLADSTALLAWWTKSVVDLRHIGGR